MSPERRRADRRGNTLAILAILLPVLIGFVALSADVAVTAATRAQLQTVADAAALAGADQLATSNRLKQGYVPTTEAAQAQSQAQATGQANRALDRAAVVLTNANNDPSGDIVLGTLDPTVKGSTLVVTAQPTATTNSVQVTARRDPNHGGIVPSFFAQVLGIGGTPVAVQATATAQNFAINGFKTVAGHNAPLIPIALDLTTYQGMIGGKTADQYAVNPTTGAVTSGADGISESNLYPVGSGPGNWGTVRIGTSNNSTSFLTGQLQNGVSPADLSAFPGGAIQLGPTTGTIALGGNPGLSLGIKNTLLGLVGKTVVIPIYDPNQSGGNGSNYNYTIVAFEPVVVVDAYFYGANRGMIVQPAFIDDPTILTSSPQSSFASGGVIRTFLSR